MTITAARFAGLTAATILVLAGCSGSPDADPTDALEPTSPTSPTSTAPTNDASAETPSVGNTDDPLCAAALKNFEQANDLNAKTSDLQALLQDPDFLTSGDATELNAWGEDMLAMSSATADFYALGVSETAGEAVSADFETLGAFVESYSTALAKAAADAASPEAFLTSVQEVFASDGVLESAQDAPTAASNVATYLGTRCELTS